VIMIGRLSDLGAKKGLARRLAGIELALEDPGRLGAEGK